MSRGPAWVGVVLAAAVLALVPRIALDLDFEYVLWIEASIFSATAGALLMLYRRDPASPGWRRGLQVVLIASFFLGAIRSALWASGRSVTLANAVILGLACAAWLLWRYRRGKGPGSAPLPTPTNHSVREVTRDS